MKDRYAMLTVDVEALPKRASDDHVQRLMWGRHANGTAGIAELVSTADDFAAPHVFFVDLCGAHDRSDEVFDVIRWLDQSGQDVQLHAHPECLPDAFWRSHRLATRPRMANLFDDARASFTVSHFAGLMAGVTGKPVRAFRAGSFRWNTATIRALDAAGIPLSFNNSTTACLREQASFSKYTNKPFQWSNGVVEVPFTERQFSVPGREPMWGLFQFPADHARRNQLWRVLAPYTWFADTSFLVLLLHSWSLLYWDEHGLAEYRDDKRLEDYRRLVRKLSKDYDIITTADFLDLQACGKIDVSHRVDLSLAERSPGVRGR